MLYLFPSFGMMLVTAACIYRWFLSPALAKLDPVLVLQILLAVHCFRFVSPISLIPGVTVPGLSTAFTYPQVIGDAATAIFALIAITAVRSRWKFAMSWVWFTNLFGLLDLAVITVQGFRYDFPAYVGGMFYVVVWFVPWLVVSHMVILAWLTRRGIIRAA
jgi:hypothetical protein